MGIIPDEVGVMLGAIVVEAVSFDSVVVVKLGVLVLTTIWGKVQPLSDPVMTIIKATITKYLIRRTVSSPL